ncbi:hypothetical protein ACLOJK_006540 [Asimina triloba]
MVDAAIVVKNQLRFQLQLRIAGLTVVSKQSNVATMIFDLNLKFGRSIEGEMMSIEEVEDPPFSMTSELTLHKDLEMRACPQRGAKGFPIGEARERRRGGLSGMGKR